MNRASVARLGASPGIIPSAPFSISRTIVSTITSTVPRALSCGKSGASIEIAEGA